MLLISKHLLIMNFGQECYLFYDKYGGKNHGYNNPVTNKIKISELFEIKINDNKTEYLTGKDAVMHFNAKFGTADNFKLPDNICEDIITFHMFNYKNLDDCDISITVVSIDTAKLTHYYVKNKSVPNKDLIITTCRYHISYEKITDNIVGYETIVSDITKKVIVPNLDIMDPIINHPEFMKPGKTLYDYQRRTIQWMRDTEI